MLLRKAERRHGLVTADYARLAAFRRALREFLRFSEEAAAAAGLTAQHYQAMLMALFSRESSDLLIRFEGGGFSGAV